VLGCEFSWFYLLTLSVQLQIFSSWSCVCFALITNLVGLCWLVSKTVAFIKSSQNLPFFFLWTEKQPIAWGGIFFFKLAILSHALLWKQFLILEKQFLILVSQFVKFQAFPLQGCRRLKIDVVWDPISFSLLRAIPSFLIECRCMRYYFNDCNTYFQSLCSTRFDGSRSKRCRWRLIESGCTHFVTLFRSGNFHSVLLDCKGNRVQIPSAVTLF